MAAKWQSTSKPVQLAVSPHNFQRAEIHRGALLSRPGERMAAGESKGVCTPYPFGVLLSRDRLNAGNSDEFIGFDGVSNRALPSNCFSSTPFSFLFFFFFFLSSADFIEFPRNVTLYVRDV